MKIGKKRRECDKRKGGCVVQMKEKGFEKKIFFK